MNNNTLLPIPKGRVATLFGGVALMASGFAAVWYGLMHHQARLEEHGIYAPWEYRLLQAQATAGNPSRPGIFPRRTPNTTVSHKKPGRLATHPPTEPNVNPESSQARADSAVPSTSETKFGESADPDSGPRPGPEPTPQRTGYVDDEHPPKDC
ncbi:hypothetical protein V8E55_007961 [Tylopilus felleus]